MVSRCSYALNNGGEALSGCIKCSKHTVKRAGKGREGTGGYCENCYGGNSCMHHLFLGIPTDTLALAPYTPKVTEAQELMAAQMTFMYIPGRSFGGFQYRRFCRQRLRHVGGI